MSNGFQPDMDSPGHLAAEREKKLMLRLARLRRAFLIGLFLGCVALAAAIAFFC